MVAEAKGLGYFKSRDWAGKSDWLTLYEELKPQHDDIIRKLEAGQITTADAFNAIQSLGVWRTRPSTDPILRQINMDLKELYDPLTNMKINDPRWRGPQASAHDAPYLDQYDHDYIKKLYDDINNPKEPEQTLPEPDEFIQGELDLANVRPGMLGIPGSEEEGTKFPMPIIEGEFEGDPGIGPDSVPTPTEQYYNPPQSIANMPPSLNTPYLPGGQRTDGIPNIDNPKLQQRLRERKGIKGPTGATLPPVV